jgi:hypothetical protein
MLRLCLIAALCIVGFSAAQFTCPTATVDAYSVTNFTAAVTCRTSLCSCLGGTGTTTCTVTTKANCTTTANCVLAFVQCMNNVSSSNPQLHMSLLAIASGELYNASAAFTSCRAFTCATFNASASTTACAGTTGNWVIPYDSVCKSTAVFRGTLRLAGNFTAILRNATAKELLRLAVQNDLSLLLGFIATVTDLQDGSLIVLFEVPVAAGNTVLASRLVTAGANANWLTQTKSTFTSLGGDASSITVIGIGATPTTPTGPTTPSPPTPPTPPTTPTPGVVTPAPTSGSVAATLTQVLVALAAVLLLA